MANEAARSIAIPPGWDARPGLEPGPPDLESGALTEASAPPYVIKYTQV